METGRVRVEASNTVHWALCELEADCGVEFRHLAEAERFSEGKLTEARDLVDQLVNEHLVDRLDGRDLPAHIVVLGSVARREATAASDFDWLVVVHGRLPDVSMGRDLIQIATDTQKRLGFREPSRTSLFGTVVSHFELVERIGLEEDTNFSHTRRVLLLEESASLYRDDLHVQLLCDLIERYLTDRPDYKQGVPRFLLNDILRYWRTVTVDYQAKVWKDLEPTSGLRYLKLRISRKLTYVGALVPVLFIEMLSANGKATPDYLVEQFQIPPLARLAQIYPHLDDDGRAALCEVVGIADGFVGALANEEFRERVRTCDAAQLDTVDGGQEQRDAATALQAALERVLFAAPLADVARKYVTL